MGQAPKLGNLSNHQIIHLSIHQIITFTCISATFRTSLCVTIKGTISHHQNYFPVTTLGGIP